MTDRTRWRRAGPGRALAAAAALAALSSGAPPARAQGADLGPLSLQRLLDIDVSSVSKRSERLQDVATSIYVITAEDIRRSGATRIQEVLSMAPGAWFGDASYTITSSSIREGAHTFAQTLLWILDGVPINNPVSGGIVFDVLDLPLADIERIEVIKGPGGTLYGANAASGIISIFTRDGEASRGLHAAFDGGTRGYAVPYLSYGFEPRENWFLTGWARLKRHEGYAPNPLFAGDSLWAPLKAGGKVRVPNSFHDPLEDGQEAMVYGSKFDFQPLGPWRLQGSVARSVVASGKYRLDQEPWPEERPTGPHALQPPPARKVPDEDRLDQIIARARLDWALPGSHALFVNASHWHHDFRWLAGPGVNNDFDISDLEAQGNLANLGRHRLSVGANVRRVEYRFSALDGGPTPLAREPERTAWLFGAFLLDEMALGRDWKLTVGAKGETWTLVGPVPEISPSLRLAWRAGPDLTFWGAASRSVTMPSYTQTDMEFPVRQAPPAWWFEAQGLSAPPGAGKVAALMPGDDVKPGSYWSLEAGSRGLLGPRVQWDVSLFYSMARDQVAITRLDETLRLVAPSRNAPGDTVIPLWNANLWQHDNLGGEAILRLLPWDRLRLELSYALFEKINRRGLPIPGDSLGRTFDVTENGFAPRYSPAHVGRLKAWLELPSEVRLTVLASAWSAYTPGSGYDFVNQRPDPELGAAPGPVSPRYHLDASLGRSFWRDRLSILVWGRDLLAQEPYVEVYNTLAWSTYPNHVHATYGGGLELRF